MKLNKTMGRVATTLVATAMLASVAVVPAFAEDTDPITSVAFTKNVTTDGNTYAPATTFEFEIKTAGATTATIDGDRVAVLEGVEGVLSVSDIVSTPNTGAATSNNYVLNGTITVNESAFNNAEPGIYHYTLSETEGNYTGIDYDDTIYDVYVYYMNNDSLTDKYVKAVIVTLNGEKQSNIVFTNDYGKDNDTTHDVTVNKIVTGSFANMSDTFSFDVSVSGTAGEAYKVVYTNGGDVQDATFVTSGDTITVDGIGDDDTITIYGLASDDTYTVKEKDAKGYEVTDTVGANDGEVSGKVTTDGATATITNTKDGSAPTGIVMDIAPYALLVVVAAAGCFVFMRKRRED